MRTDVLNYYAFCKLLYQKRRRVCNLPNTYNDNVRYRKHKHECTSIVEFMGHPILVRFLKKGQGVGCIKSQPDLIIKSAISK